MNFTPSCSIVIPAYNEQVHLESTLLSLSNQSIPRESYEIIVVDNGSTDKTTDLAEKYADRVLVVPELNVGAVRNQGIKSASSDIIVCTDADCVVEYTWLERGISLLNEYPQHTFGGGLRPSNTSSWVEEKWLLNPNGKAFQQKSLMGSCIFIWKRDFEAVGGFLEDITSGEDSDLSERLEKQSIQVVINNELSVIHNGGAKTIREFFKRQIWHSENYYNDFKKLLSDKVLFLTALYSANFILILFFTFSHRLNLLLISLMFFLAVPAILSIKRIIRANYQPTSLVDLLSIYSLDHIYILARSIGSIKGILKRE